MIQLNVRGLSGTRRLKFDRFTQLTGQRPGVFGSLRSWFRGSGCVSTGEDNPREPIGPRTRASVHYEGLKKDPECQCQTLIFWMETTRVQPSRVLEFNCCASPFRCPKAIKMVLEHLLQNTPWQVQARWVAIVLLWCFCHF